MTNLINFIKNLTAHFNINLKHLKLKNHYTNINYLINFALNFIYFKMLIMYLYIGLMTIKSYFIIINFSKKKLHYYF